MCGIVGIVHHDCAKACEERTLIAMRDLLAHRGPDDQGFLIDKNVGLGHRRLSIIDIAGGHQPLSNEDGRLWIVFNGEIYNFRDIRTLLLSKGHVFRSNSDTEVILHLYEEKGVDCVSDLNGIFAFAIWDRRDRSLFLARDHMGVKPLYYAMLKDVFLFSSEIKSILKSGDLAPKCNEDAVLEYFLFRHVAGADTLFENVENLLPGHSLRLKGGKIELRQYWSAFPSGFPAKKDFGNTREELSFLIQDAVGKQLMSDVPLGAFCSGGLDSSLVTALSARKIPHPINTFSVGFHETDYDETYFARVVSNKYRTNHHELRLDNRTFSELLPKTIWHNDEPLNFANSVQIYALSKLAKEHVTVVLTGEGSDELFAGYPRYMIPRLGLWYRKLPPFAARWIQSLGRRLLGDHRVEKLDHFSRFSLDEMILYNASFLDKGVAFQLLNNASFNGFSYRESCLRKGRESGLDPLTAVALMDEHTYLVSILNRQDKMSMAAGLESRVPFLDYRIAGFSNRIPIAYKLKEFHTKYILKQVAKPFLPHSVINRRKSGFGVPLAEWMREKGGMGDWLDSLCDDPDLGVYLDRGVVKKMVERHKSREEDHSDALWTVLNFQLWRKAFKV